MTLSYEVWFAAALLCLCIGALLGFWMGYGFWGRKAADALREDGE